MPNVGDWRHCAVCNISFECSYTDSATCKECDDSPENRGSYIGVGYSVRTPRDYNVGTFKGYHCRSRQLQLGDRSAPENQLGGVA